MAAPMEPDLIVISDDDEPVIPSEIVPVRPKTISPATDQVTSPPRTPGRLSLSYNKCKTSGIEFLTFTPKVKQEIKSPITSPTCTATSKSTSAISSETPQLLRDAKLQSIIERFRKKSEAVQVKSNENLMLPVPESGPLEPYHRPEHVNEVHSSTEGNEMKSNNITRMFDSCREFSKDKDDQVIIEKMFAKVKKCDPSYTNSLKFLDFTKSIHAKILLNTANMHLYLKEFYDELSSLPSSKKAKLKSGEDGTRSTPRNIEIEAGPSASRSPSDGHEPDTTSVETGNEKHIQRLEKLLKKCSKKVKKLEEKEMSVDDLDNDGSVYILIDRYKRKCLQIWKKLCELNGQKKAETGRVTEKKFIYEGSRYPELNKAVSRLVNRSKSFPDFCDVTDLITQCNEQFDLHLRPFQIDTLAREAFKGIGKELKRRRILDYEEHFGCPMLNPEELDNDPASQDSELNAKLAESTELGRKKANEVFESFVLKQVELDQQPPKPEGSESQNEEESEEEEDAEKEASLSVAEIESESESDGKEDEDEVEIDADENMEEEEEESDSAETDVDAIEEDSGSVNNVVQDTIQISQASNVMPRDHFSPCSAKRSLNSELLDQPLPKRPSVRALQEVQVKIVHNIEDFPKPHVPDLSNQDSNDSEIFIIE